MKKTHVTKDGRKILIASMENDHLINTIKLYCNNIKSSLNFIDNYSNLKESEKLLYFSKRDIDEESIENAKSTIQANINNLSSYVFEACIRNLNISEYLQDAFNRKDILNKQNVITESIVEDNEIFLNS